MSAAMPTGSSGQAGVDKGSRIALALFLGPTILVMTFVIAIPLAGIAMTSLTNDNGFTLENYTSFFGDRYDLGVLLNTATTGIMAALIALVIGYPTALYLRFGPHVGRRYIALIVISPLLISVVVRSFALTLLIGPNNPIEQIVRIVVPDARLNLLFTRGGVLVGLVYTLTPFMILSLVSSMSAIDSRMLSAARSLGAGTWTVLVRIVLPLTLPGILSGCFAVFSLSVTSFVLPILLGGSGYTMMAQLINQQVLLLFNWPAGYALSLILLIFNGLLLATSALLVRWLVATKPVG
jgi:putative spermidine/putrescine transport system permease protein